MTLLRLSPAQRRISLTLLIAGAAALAYIGTHAGATTGGFVCCLLAIVLLGLAYAATSTPVPVDRDGEYSRSVISAGPRGPRTEPTYAVAVAFVGEPGAVFGRLAFTEHVFGGSGICDAVDHDAHVTVEMVAPTADQAREGARRLVETAGGLVVHVDEPRWIS